MDRHQVGARVTEPLHIADRFHDHQVDVQEHVCHLADGLEDRQADGDVGNEYAVHHIHMDIIGGGDAVDVPLQIGKISGEDGRCDFDHGNPSFLSVFRRRRTDRPDSPGGGRKRRGIGCCKRPGCPQSTVSAQRPPPGHGTAAFLNKEPVEQSAGSSFALPTVYQTPVSKATKGLKFLRCCKDNTYLQKNACMILSYPSYE